MSNKKESVIIGSRLILRHFSHLSETDKNTLFLNGPEDIFPDSEKELIATGLGASLYSPATRPTLAKDIVKNAARGVGSAIICLEDSIPDNMVEEGQKNLVIQLAELDKVEPSKLPLLFVRIRNVAHLEVVAGLCKDYLHLLTGFVLPKFGNDDQSASNYVQAMNLINSGLSGEGNRSLYFMPVLESTNLIFRETRERTLALIQSALMDADVKPLAIRIGATDMSSPFALRRSRDLTIYDVHVVSSVIADIVNTFGRAENGYVVTGPVWEHFTDRERLFKPRLRQSPFADHESMKMRQNLVMQDLDGLIREIELDRANGLLGKTVIHPLHVALVNCMSVVTHEEYSDAMDIISASRGEAGARASAYRNKMNEQKPHYAWAKKTLLRSKAFGVANEGITFADILNVGLAEYV